MPVPSIVQVGTCSDDAARMTFLLNNMTAHLDLSIEGSEAEAAALHAQVAESSGRVNTVLDERRVTATKVAELVAYRRSGKVKATLIQSTLSTELQSTQQQIANLTVNCVDQEQAFRTQQSENTNTLRFLGGFRKVLANFDVDAEDIEDQALLQGVYELMPLATSTISSSSATPSMLSKMEDLQNLVQTSQATATPEEMTMASMLAEMQELLLAIEDEAKTALKQAEADMIEAAAVCKRRAETLRMNAIDIDAKLADVAVSIASLVAEEKRLEAERVLVAEEIALLERALADKADVLAQMSAIIQSRVEGLSRERNSLQELFTMGLPRSTICSN